jgi:hypothetical protein
MMRRSGPDRRRAVGALCGERDREREKKLKGDCERMQGGAFVSRCDGRGQEEWGGGRGTYRPCKEGEGGQSWEGS